MKLPSHTGYLLLACIALGGCDRTRDARNVATQLTGETPPVTSSTTVQPPTLVAGPAAVEGSADDWSERAKLPLVEGRRMRPRDRTSGLFELDGHTWRIRPKRKPRPDGRLASDLEAERASVLWIEEQFGKQLDSQVKLVVESTTAEEGFHSVGLRQTIHGIPIGYKSTVEIDKDGILSADCTLTRFEVMPNSDRAILTRQEAVDAKVHTLETDDQKLADAYKRDARLTYVEITSRDLRDTLDVEPDGDFGIRTRWVPEWTLDPNGWGRYTMKAFRKGQSPGAKAQEDRERADAWSALMIHETDDDWTTLAVLPVLRGTLLKPPADKIVEYGADNVGFMKHPKFSLDWEYRTAPLMRDLTRLQSKGEAARLATAWLEENFAPFAVMTTVVVTSVDESEHRHDVHFEQRFRAIRAERSHATVSIDTNGIEHANFCLYEIEVVRDSARKIVTKEAAVDTWYKLWFRQDESEAEQLKQKSRPRLIYRHADFSDFDDEEVDNGEDHRSIRDKDDRWIPAYEIDPEGILMIDAFTGRAWYND